MLHVKLLHNVHYMSNYYRMCVTRQNTTGRTLHVKLLQNVHCRSNYYRMYITCQTATIRCHSTIQCTCTLHVKLLQNVHHSFYKTYIRYQTTIDCTSHFKLLLHDHKITLKFSFWHCFRKLPPIKTKPSGVVWYRLYLLFKLFSFSEEVT